MKNKKRIPISELDSSDVLTSFISRVMRVVSLISLMYGVVYAVTLVVTKWM